MKKTLIVVALAMAFVFAFSAAALAVGPFYNTSTNNAAVNAFNQNYPGYLRWSYAQANLAGAGTSPHGNYATSTNKCAVCHSVHRAVKGGAVLTAITGRNLYTTDTDGVGSSSPSGYTKGCGFCHGATPTFSTKQVGMAADGSISPHSNCNRCHIESPHGAGASVFANLKALMFNEEADGKIEFDLAASNNGLTEDMFDGSNPALVETGQTLGTGYLCSSCHQHGGGTIDLAFAVNTAGAAPAEGGEGSAPSTGTVTGHRVTALATTNWNQTVPGGDYNAFYTGGGAVGAQSVIAWAPANSCQTCHDAKKADGSYAFPHGYVTAAGTYASKTSPGTALIWLTTAADADDAHAILDDGVNGTGNTNVNANNNALTEDGLCIKCHINGAGDAGVGLTY